MSNLGNIGSWYSNRVSGATGKLVERDDENKIFTFVTENNEEFTVTFGQFKSNWRRMKEEPVVDESSEEVENPFDGITVVDTTPTKEKLKNFVADMQNKREICLRGDENEIELEVEGILALRAKVLEHCIHAEMLPDVYTYSNWANKIVVGTVHFNGRGDMCINFDAKEIDLGDLLNIVKDAVVELNLYGYRYE